MKIAIYIGPGTSQLCVRALITELSPRAQIQLLDATRLIKSSWRKQCDVFVMPGGRDRPYCDTLSGEGNEVIRSFVESGGKYLGICAGAYYACSHIVWDKGTADEIDSARELAFFPGRAIGPAFGSGTFGYEAFSGADLVGISDQLDRDHQIYYHGGCYFEQLDDKSRILANYRDLPSNPIAAVTQPVGNGLALLVGVHPEIGVNTLTPEMPSRLRESIIAAESQRQEFCAQLWDLVGL